MTEESWSKFMESLEKNEEYHRRYHAAVANPVRRKILSLIARGLSKSDILNELKLSERQLDYHLRLLEHGFCIKRDGDSFKLTKEGEVVYYLVKEKSKY